VVAVDIVDEPGGGYGLVDLCKEVRLRQFLADLLLSFYFECWVGLLYSGVAASLPAAGVVP